MQVKINSKTHGVFNTVIDENDFDKIKNYKWSIYFAKNTGKYYVRSHSFNGRRCKEVQLQRIIMDAPEGKQVDHIDGDPLNNRKINLRVCSQTENCRNRGRSKNNSSGYKGIYPCKKRWQASICVDRKARYLGSYKTKEDAARAYNEAALKYFGEFACLNEVK